MAQLLSFLSVCIAAIAAFAPLLPAFIPRLGLLLLYRTRLIRIILLIVAWALAIAAFVDKPSSLVALPFVIIFSIPAIIMEPQRIFVALNDPERMPASLADFPDEALVLGYEDDDHNAIAWPFETLVPRHLINDRFGEAPLLVAY